MTNKPPLRPATPIDTELAKSSEVPTPIEKKKRDAEKGDNTAHDGEVGGVRPTGVIP